MRCSRPGETISGWWRTKDAVYLILAVLFLLLFAFGIAIGVCYWFGFPYHDASVLPLFGIVCTPTTLAPGLLLLFFGLRARKQEGHIVEFAAWVKTYRRIGLPDLARKVGKSELEAEKLLVDVVDKGLVHGFVDRQTNEFVVQESLGFEQYVDKCPSCGATIQRRYLKGETVVCPFCSSVIVGYAPPKPDRSA